LRPEHLVECVSQMTQLCPQLKQNRSKQCSEYIYSYIAFRFLRNLFLFKKQSLLLNKKYDTYTK